jgi:hypothetical protein
MRIRSVLDARPSAPPRYLGQTLLLAHSWAASGGTPPLEVIVLGTMPPPVQARLCDLGVEVTTSPPHALESVSKVANKLVALSKPSDTPILLVDNDVCFLDDVSDLGGREVRASVANSKRVRHAQWAYIAQTTNLRPLPDEWVSLREQLKARATGRAPEASRKVYLNGGVIWVRQPAVFGSIWAAHNDAIARAFGGHPLSSWSVRGSEQASLATAVAGHGGFDLLSPAYNYRPLCFGLGLPDQPKILHLCKLGNRQLPTFSKTLIAYWDNIVIPHIKLASPASAVTVAGGSIGPADRESERLLDEALSVRDRLLRITAEAGLDTFRSAQGTDLKWSA